MNIMNIVRIRMTFAVALVLVLTATGLWAAGAEEEPAAAAEKEMVLDPTTGEMVTAPEYGGTITTKWWAPSDPAHGDTWYGALYYHIGNLVLETLGIGDWGLDRDVFDFKSTYVTLAVTKPHLAEGYETPDPFTTIFHIRKGVRWHDKAPMNGRELTAYDVEHSFHRFLGFGDFAEAGPSPFVPSLTGLPIESVTATDKWTVVFKMSSFSFNTLDTIYFSSVDGSWIQPPEVIQQHGDLQDWRNLVGTGPYELTDWIKGSSITYTKNPDYWGYDEKYPKNRLPYADKIKFLVISDEATQLAALRSGKIATMLASEGALDLDQAESMRRAYPEIVLDAAYLKMNDFGMDVRKPPFDDIRVRQAMQLALDNETIARTLYRGHADPTPYGIMGPAAVGYYVPYEEWPEEVKEGYRYDPAGAEALLEAAGYERGADGIRFKTTLDFSDGAPYMDVDYVQVSKAYWAEIGVDVELNVIDTATFNARINDHTYEGITTGLRGGDWAFTFLRILGHSTSVWNMHGGQDPEYDAMVEAAEAATTLEELMRLSREADMYFIKKQWQTWGVRPAQFSAYWPWLGGFNGETGLGGGMRQTVLSRVWVDSDLKYELTGQR